MTKKEKQMVEELLTEAALRRTAPVEPDVDIPPAFNGGSREISTGFLFRGALGASPRVEYAASTSVSHKASYNPINIETEDRYRGGGWSQGARQLYSTKLLALKALRHELERQCCRTLREIDKQIEEEIQKQNGGK